MLSIPTSFARSTEQHNVKLQALCDWIEGSLLFDALTQSISYSDIIDVLLEEQIYDDQDFASELVRSAWAEIRRRQRSPDQGSPFEIETNRIIRLRPWEEVPEYSFCLLLSLGVWLGLQRVWQEKFGGGYTEQGELFELLTKEALAKQFPDWKFSLTGWSRTSARKLAEVVSVIVDLLREEVGKLEWAGSNANEAGLDLLCYRSFADERVGIPVYLIQCATGANWRSKVHTPDINLWKHIIDFAATPLKGFAIPFALSEEEFRQNCVLVNGFLIDRYRILAASSGSEEWVSPDLRSRLVEWMEPRAAELPYSDG
ncbi:MAG: hypothetical protein M5U05_18690 [Anaerolineales bacterium]|nr:hypothetical protein [Anaerolineales bacterium]